MVTFDLDIVGKVQKACNQETIPLTEEVTEFIFGCHLKNKGSNIAFHVDSISTELGFSPDVDILEMVDGKGIGYEVKGVRGSGKIEKNQLYTGVGQAQLLLTRPLTFSDGFDGPTPVLRKSYLVYPKGTISASDEWTNTFIEAIENLPSVGLIAISRQQKPEIIVEAEPNIPPSHECGDLDGLAREKCLKLHGERLQKLLLQNNTGKSIKNPQRSLEVLAEEIAEDHDIDLISFA